MLRPPSEPPASRAAAGSTGRTGAHPPNPRTGALLAQRRAGVVTRVPTADTAAVGPAEARGSPSVGGAGQRGRQRPRQALARCPRPHRRDHAATGDVADRRPPPARGRLRSLPAGIRRAARRGRFGRKPTGFPPSRALSAGCLAAPGAHVTFFTGYPGLVSPGWQMLGLRESRRRWLSTHFRIGTPPSGHSSNR